MEAEKRVRKRRMRLLLAVEDAFAHANRMAKETGFATGNSLAPTSGFSGFQNGESYSVF